MGRVKGSAPRRGRGSVSLLVCDDHVMVTDAIELMLERDERAQLVGPPTAQPDVATELALSSEPDVVLMGLHFGGQPLGLEATRTIVDRDPSARVVLMTGYFSDAELIEAIEVGAAAFVSKTKGLAELIEVVIAVAAGESIFPDTVPALLRKVSRERAAVLEARSRLTQLTPREEEILHLITEGLGNEEIGARLYISGRTVETHVHNLVRKLGVTSKLQAAVFAVRHEAVAV